MSTGIIQTETHTHAYWETGVLEWEERKNEGEEIFEKIMAKSFPKIEDNTDPKTFKIKISIYLKKKITTHHTSGHIKKSWRQLEKEIHYIQRGKRQTLQLYFSSDTTQSTSQWSDIF